MAAMNYARITIEGALESVIFSQDEIEQGYAIGFKPLITNNLKPDTIGLQGIEVHYEQTEDSIVASYIVVDNHPVKVNAEISRLQKLLSDDDYKITKCQEYALISKPLPYDIKTIHSEREMLRIKINQLQTLTQ